MKQMCFGNQGYLLTYRIAGNFRGVKFSRIWLKQISGSKISQVSK